MSPRGLHGPFEVYQYRHPDGRTKEWAFVRFPEGDYMVRWGPNGRLAQSRSYPAASQASLRERSLEKEAKGYRLLGLRYLDQGWCVVDQPRPDTFQALARRVKSAKAAPPEPSAAAPGADLSQLIGSGDEKSWYF